MTELFPVDNKRPYIPCISLLSNEAKREYIEGMREYDVFSVFQGNLLVFHSFVKIISRRDIPQGVHPKLGILSIKDFTIKTRLLGAVKVLSINSDNPKYDNLPLGLIENISTSLKLRHLASELQKLKIGYVGETFLMTTSFEEVSDSDNNDVTF